MRREGLWLAGALTLAMGACKPPPSDNNTARAATTISLRAPSAPMDSPDATGALWMPGESRPDRIIYGKPGAPVLLALECERGDPDAPVIRISRYAPADKDAGALLALIGNGAIGRLEVDATQTGKRRIWQGEAPADHPGWEPLNGPREITATVPGAGLVALNPSDLPMQFLEDCRPVPSDPPQPAG